MLTCSVLTKCKIPLQTDNNLPKLGFEHPDSDNFDATQPQILRRGKKVRDAQRQKSVKAREREREAKNEIRLLYR